MKNKMFMTCIQILEKRLERKKEQLTVIETVIEGGGLATAVEKRKYIELKAVVQELENVLDIAVTMYENDNETA